MIGVRMIAYLTSASSPQSPHPIQSNPTPPNPPNPSQTLPIPSTMAPSFTIKSNFNGDIRRTTSQSVPTFAQLASLESSMYRFSNPVTLKYLDEENDAVTLANDEDVATAFGAAAAVGSFLVHVLAVESVNTTVAANINSPITTVADNPITAVPIDARGTVFSLLSFSFSRVRISEGI